MVKLSQCCANTFVFIGVFLRLQASMSYAQDKVAWPRPDPGSHPFSSVKLEWKDAARDRVVPVKIFYPDEVTSAAPVILFSHGTGGSRDGYGYLGRFWASHGYISVHPQHHGSDSDIFKGNANILDAVKQAATNPKNAVDRQKDIIFVLDQLTKLNLEYATFKGKLNLEAIGMSGHSFGAHTTMAAAGQAIPGRKIMDSRIKAIVPMSAQPPKLEGALAGIKTPTMLMSGTLDDSPIGNVKAKDRRITYDKLTGVDKWFINFDGGDHMIFSGRTGPGDRTKDAEFQRCIKQVSLAFWDAYLKNDGSARAWIGGRELKEYLGKLATVESKMAR
jgi:predicted dienelactone hydrolase